MQHLTAEQKQYILRRYQEGASLRGIGREIGRPDITIRRTLEALGTSFGPPKTTNKRSSPETEAHVLRLYDEGASWKEIIEQADVTSTTVSKILERNGRLLDRKPESVSANSDIIVAAAGSGSSARQIGRALGHSKTTISRIIAESGVDVPKARGCEYPDFFERIDTPEKAYWLGFLSADGCIKTTARHPEGDYLSIELGLKDFEHLAKLKKDLGAYANVRKASKRNNGKLQHYAALAVGSRRLAIALMGLGVGPRKSATVEPWDGPADLVPHYWRGLFDGDGSIARKGEGLWTMFLCGSEPCVRGFTAWASAICGTKAQPYFRTGCWYVSISGRFQVAKLARAMYGDAPVSLDRKQERADLIVAAA